jgi:hypothetical protein
MTRSTLRCSGRPDPVARLGVVLRRCNEGQGGPVIAEGEQLLGKPFTYSGRSKGNSGAVMAEAEGSGLGELPGLEAELLCGSGGAGVRQSGVAAAERDALHGDARWRAEIWVWTAVAWCGRVQGGAQGPNKRWSRDLGVRVCGESGEDGGRDPRGENGSRNGLARSWALVAPLLEGGAGCAETGRWVTGARTGWSGAMGQ